MHTGPEISARSKASEPPAALVPDSAKPLATHNTSEAHSSPTGDINSLSMVAANPIASTHREASARPRDPISNSVNNWGDTIKRAWKPAVRVAKTLAYTSTTLVAGATTAFAVDSIFGINTFKFFHDHPGLSAVMAAAHSVVMFLAVSGGIGLAKFRSQRESADRTAELINTTFVSHRSTLDKIELKTKPFRIYSDQVGTNAEQFLQAYQGLRCANVCSAASEEAISGLCQNLVNLKVVFRQLNSNNLERSLVSSVIERVQRQVNRIPKIIAHIQSHFQDSSSQVILALRDGCEDTDKAEAVQRLITSYQNLLESGAQLASAIQEKTSKNETANTGLQAQLDLRELRANLSSVNAHSLRWKQLHAELRDKYPKEISSDFQLEAEDLLEGLEELKQELIDQTGAPKDLDEITRELAHEQLKKLRNAIVQLHARSDSVQMPEALRILFTHTRDCISTIQDSTPPSQMIEKLLEGEQAFRRFNVELKRMGPQKDAYAGFRLKLMKEIEEFSARYPKLAVQASFAGFAASVSYWVCCSEALDWLFPTGSDMYDSLYVAAKHSKYAFPFALNIGIVFAAGAINYRFRPYLVWSSLELSKATFLAVSPFAWAWDKAQARISRAIDFIEPIVVKNNFTQSDR